MTDITAHQLQASLASPPVAQGKTKVIYPLSGYPGKGLFTSMNAITAGDGQKRDVLEGKGELANRTTCNVFALLKYCGIPVAFDMVVAGLQTSTGEIGGFIAPLCKMLPYEVVVRAEAWGSYLKRRTDLREGCKFDKPIVEFFLKTSGRKWRDYDLVCDDPLLRHDGFNHRFEIYDPKTPDLPDDPAKPFLVLPDCEILTITHELELMDRLGNEALAAFRILQSAWAKLGRRLVDYKIEGGLTDEGELLIADVIDNDSWRLKDEEGDMSKQAYRDGEPLEVVLRKFQAVTELTDRFSELGFREEMLALVA